LIFDEVKAYKKLCNFWATRYMSMAAILDSEKATRVASGHPR